LTGSGERATSHDRDRFKASLTEEEEEEEEEIGTTFEALNLWVRVRQVQL
jgi:hypothetical protein